MPTQVKHKSRRKHGESGSLLKGEFDDLETLRIVAVIAIVAIVLLMLTGLFAPGLRYWLVLPPEKPVDGQAFLNELEPLGSKVKRNNQIEVIENGENFYEAELDMMRHASRSINIEAYIFHKGQVTDRADW